MNSTSHRRIEADEAGPMSTLNVVQHGVIIFIISVSISFSSFIIWLMFVEKRARRRCSNKIFLSLIFAHLVNSVMRLGYACNLLVLGEEGVREKIGDPRILYLIGAISSFTELQHLIWLSIDRFLCIKYPYFYEKYATSKNTHRLIAILWTFVIIRVAVNVSIYVCAEKLVVFRFLAISVMVTVILGTIWLSISNVIILRVAHRQISSIRNTQPSQKHKSKFKKLHRERRAAIICGMVVINFIITWSPSLVMVFLKYLHRCICDELTFTAILFIVTGGLANHVIYVAFNAELRKLAKSRVRKLFCCWTTSPNTSLQLSTSSS